MEHDMEGSERAMGQGEFANMPRREMFKAYPKGSYGYSEYNDTMKGIDRVNEESYRKIKANPSKQK